MVQGQKGVIIVGVGEPLAINTLVTVNDGMVDLKLKEYWFYSEVALSDFLLLYVFIGAVVMLLLFEGYYPPTVFVPTVVHSNTPHGTEEEG